MSIKAVIFDLDGTLANSLEDLADATNYTLRKFGFCEHNLEQYKFFVGNGMKKLLLRAVGKSLTEPEYQEIYNCFIKKYSENYCNKTKVYFNLPQVLQKLKSNNIKLAVVTNKVNFMAKTVTEKLYGKNLFCTVLGQSEEYPAKPNPEVVFRALKTMGVSAEECVFVGDSDVDIYTGHNAGMKSVGVLWGFRTKQELTSAGADFVITEPNELLNIIN